MTGSPDRNEEMIKGVNNESSSPNMPTIALVIGMAGTGKSTLTHRLNLHCISESEPTYFINLDPAVIDVPYGVNIDIRDSISYKDVMKTHGLGPNGAILTSLNLFATQFDEVMHFLEENQDKIKYVFVDTPGQIEVFTWSASGTLITQLLATSFPTILLYVLDGIRCTSNPQCFMSSVLYATSIMYKSQLPLLLVYNKADACDTNLLNEWMRDPKSLEDALNAHSDSYASVLYQNMSLLLSEFYESIGSVSLSAATGQGMEELFKAILDSRAEYFAEFASIHLRKLRQREEEVKTEMERVVNDMSAINTSGT